MLWDQATSRRTRPERRNRSLTVDDAAQGQIAKGGRLCLVIVPADAAVAATYFGASEDAKDKSPRLTLDLP